MKPQPESRRPRHSGNSDSRRNNIRGKLDSHKRDEDKSRRSGVDRSRRSRSPDKSISHQQPPSKRLKQSPADGHVPLSLNQCTGHHLSSDSANTNDPVVCKVISAISSFVEMHKQKRTAQLDQWQENGSQTSLFPPLCRRHFIALIQVLFLFYSQFSSICMCSSIACFSLFSILIEFVRLRLPGFPIAAYCRP